MENVWREIAKMIDHSLLQPDLTDRHIEKECEVAKRYDVASVCCRPCDIQRVKGLLSGSRVAVGAVVGFPHGSHKTSTKVFEAREAIADGATEIDMVLNIGKLKSGDLDYVKNDIHAVVEVAHAGGAIVKVILENYYLTDDEKQTACRLCEEAGADFVKTSTGFAGGGATIEDLVLMRDSVSSKVQVKAAGGVRDLDMALKVRNTGATRFGATRTAQILEECKKRC